jgi:hypothetical protein
VPAVARDGVPESPGFTFCGMRTFTSELEIEIAPPIIRRL